MERNSKCRWASQGMRLLAVTRGKCRRGKWKFISNSKSSRATFHAIIRDSRLVVLLETREPRSPRLFDSPVLHTGLTREQSKNEGKIFSRRFWPFLGYEAGPGTGAGAGANSFDRFGVVGKHRVP